MALELKEQLRRQLKRGGGALPDYPDGARLEHFNTLDLAQALESEVARAGIVGHTKISLHLDVADAAKLAQALRRRARL